MIPDLIGDELDVALQKIKTYDESIKVDVQETLGKDYNENIKKPGVVIRQKKSGDKIELIISYF